MLTEEKILERINKTLKAKNISGLDLGRAFGLKSPRAIYPYLQGKVKLSIKFITICADVCNVNPIVFCVDPSEESFKELIDDYQNNEEMRLIIHKLRTIIKEQNEIIDQLINRLEENKGHA